MKLLQTNLFADLHDGKKIFFCCAGLYKEVFDEIRKLNHDVILITGNNGDIPIGKYENDDDQFKHINAIFDSVPSNVKYWFAENNITKKENIIPIPIGLKNSFSHFRREHGFGYDFMEEQIELLKNVYFHDDSTPNKFLYLNYCNRPNHRVKIKEICEQHLNVKYNEACLYFEEYIRDILNHECVLCPVGVGVDTYRLYETLYCKRIPITIKVGKHGVLYSDFDELSWTGTDYAPPQKEEYPIYTELYSQLPVVMLESLEELKDINYLKNLVEEQKKKEWNRDLLDFNYWKNMILEYSKKL
jgi:hypothetical protein